MNDIAGLMAPSPPTIMQILFRPELWLMLSIGLYLLTNMLRIVLRKGEHAEHVTTRAFAWVAIVSIALLGASILYSMTNRYGYNMF